MCKFIHKAFEAGLARGKILESARRPTTSKESALKFAPRRYNPLGYDTSSSLSQEVLDERDP